jgi:hypothetical protein
MNELVPAVTVADLEAVMTMANAAEVRSFEGMFGIACTYAQEQSEGVDAQDDLAANIGFRIMALGRALKHPLLAQWNIPADEGWHINPAVLVAVATEPLVWVDGFDIESLTAHIFRAAAAIRQ